MQFYSDVHDGYVVTGNKILWLRGFVHITPEEFGNAFFFTVSLAH